MEQSLPPGIWYEAAKSRYRVRLYRQGRPYLGGYFSTLETAKREHAKLTRKLRKMDENSPFKRGRGKVPEATTVGTVKALVDLFALEPECLLEGDESDE